MSHRTARFAVAALAGLLVPLVAPVAPAHAATVTSGFVTMVSDTGDYIGGGLSNAYIAPGDAVTAAGSTTSLSLTAGGFTFSFAPPSGSDLAVGEYVGAQRTPFRQAGHPGIDITGNGRGCNTQSGRFTIYDLAFLGDGSLDRLDLTYEQHCDGAQAGLTGQVRINEPLPTGYVVAPTRVAYEDVYPQVSSRPVPVTVLNSTGAALTVGTPAVTGTDAAAFSVVSNECTSALASGARCRVQLRFTPPTSGPLTASLQLPVGTDTQVVPLTGTGIPGITSWLMTSDTGDYIGGGQSSAWTPANASITASGSEAGVHMSVSSGSHWFSADFTPDANNVLLPGATYQAQRYPFNGTAAGLDVSGDGRGCNQLTGTFTVGELGYENGQLTRFSVTFDQYCDGATAALHGALAYRATTAPPSPVDTSPPPAVSQLLGTPLDANVLLTWNVPAVTDYDHAVVRVALGRTPPTTPTSGYDVSSTAWSGVLVPSDPGQDLAFSVFPVDASGNVGPRASRVVYGTDLSGSLPATLLAGRSASVSGRLLLAADGHAVVSAPVLVYTRPNGTRTWKYVTTLTTTSTGTVTMTVAPRQSTQYLLRAPGVTNVTGAQVGPLTIQVAPIVSLTASATSVPRYHSLTMTVRTAPACPGVTAYLQRYVSGAWKTVAYHALNSSGAWTFSVSTSTRGTFSYRVVTARTALHASGTSPTRAVNIT